MPLHFTEFQLKLTISTGSKSMIHELTNKV